MLFPGLFATSTFGIIGVSFGALFSLASIGVELASSGAGVESDSDAPGKTVNVGITFFGGSGDEDCGFGITMFPAGMRLGDKPPAPAT